jgi:hypothetical protein
MSCFVVSWFASISNSYLSLNSLSFSRSACLRFEVVICSLSSNSFVLNSGSVSDRLASKAAFSWTLN